MDFDADQDDGEPIFPHSKHSDVITLNWKIMMGSAFFMCLIMFIVLILHIYSRVAMRNRARTRDNESTTNPPKPGLDPSVLASLPVFIVKDQGQIDQSDKKNTECPVCLSLFEVGKFARVLPNCKHIFHVECIDQWLSSHSTCPICRASVI